MQLVEVVSHETGITAEKIVLLRHSTDSVRVLRKCGATVEEYTALQPVGTKYDFYRNPANLNQIVVAIVEDHVYGVFKINGIARTGSNYDLASVEYILFDKSREKPPRHCHYFNLEAIPTSVIGQRVSGWETRTRTPVQRHGDSFFHEILVSGRGKFIAATSLNAKFSEEIESAIQMPRDDRIKLIGTDERIPRKIAVISYVFDRSALVVAEVLDRANGRCEACKAPAPFLRKSNGSPYLEVHHVKQLAEGGSDNLANAIAICPNCHRKAHYGDA